MFNRKTLIALNPDASASRFSLEGLEDRCMLSGGHSHHSLSQATTSPSASSAISHRGNTILFSQAPSAVQSGLTSLATTDGVTTPTTSQTVYLGNRNGVETYTIKTTGTGTTTSLTVDVNGNAVTAPTNGSTTFGAISNSAVTDEISAVATALGLTAPTSTSSVRVTTPAGGTAVYTITLSGASSTTGRHHHGTTISVDANGNLVGNVTLPFSAVPTAIQNGLNANAPAGATALASTSTQSVRIATLNGVTTYSTTFNSTGTRTTVSVNAAGTLTSLPSQSKVQFSTIPVAAQTEIQTLATADGVTGTIAGTQSVSAYDEANGKTVYSVQLTGSSTGTAQTFNVMISVDQNGNPTTLPGGGEMGGCFGGNFGGRFADDLGRFGGF